MSSRQLQSKGESDGLSLPAVTRKGKGRGKETQNQLEMDQQQQDQLQQHATVQLSLLQDQPLRPASAQITTGESATPAAGSADRPSSKLSHNIGFMQLPSVNIVPSARIGTLQVPFHNNNTQDSGSHISQMSGPLR